jgi:hypothetical protein
LDQILETISAVLCGYGYQPHRLLGWIAFQLVGFSVVLTLISSGGSFVDNVYARLINYLDPLGVGDTEGISQSALVLFAVQGYIGAASLPVFFALLVRRWFEYDAGSFNTGSFNTDTRAASAVTSPVS